MTQESVLARYKVLHEIGRGATGAVYAARDRTGGAVVALKRLDPALLNDLGPDFVAQFLHYARSARTLKHSNIVEIHDAGEAGGTPYVAMEMLEGCESLRTLLGRGPLPVARAIRIARDIASGLTHAHLQGVMHRGLKPSAVTVLRSGTAKIADFGMGQAMPLDAAVSSPAHMPPEQLRNDPIVDHRCDLYSLGVLFYEMLAGRLPYPGSTAKEVLENFARAAPRRPSELNPNVPRALDAIVTALISPQPGGRMAGAPVVLRELQRLEEALGLDSPPAAAPKEEPTPPKPAAPDPVVIPIPRAEPVLRADPAPPRVEPAPPVPPVPPRMYPMHRDPFDHRAAIEIMEREARMRRSSRARPAIVAGIALAFGVLGIVFSDAIKAGLDGYADEWIERGQLAIAALTQKDRAPNPAPPPAAPAPEMAAPQPQPAPPPAMREPVVVEPPRVVEAKPEPVPPPAVAPEAVATPPSVPPKSERPTSAVPAQETNPVVAAKTQVAQAEKEAARESSPTPKEQTGTAKLHVSVSPRGELYINGKHYGTTPPVTTVDLEPGVYQVEIRNGSAKPYLTYMTVQPGDVRRVRHDFAAKPSGPRLPTPRTAKAGSPRGS